MGACKLFDLEKDIGEQNDLSKAKPDVKAKLLKMLHEWRREVDAKMPYPKTATSKPAKDRGLSIPSPGNNPKSGSNLASVVASFAPWLEGPRLGRPGNEAWITNPMGWTEESAPYPSAQQNRPLRTVP
jgi:hypothetical protein